MNAMDKRQERIAEQAAEYFARRHGATSSKRRERDEWLDEDPRHARGYEEFQRLWDCTDSLAGDPELQALKAADLARMCGRRRFRPQRMLAVAASLVMLVGGGYLTIQFMQRPESAQYVTALGERHTEILPDGTEVVMNTDSALEMRYSRGRRYIDLKRGEAQFNVAHDASRPFVVSIGEDSVTALGTRFLVRREPDGASVTLLDGRVEVAHSDERHVLRPNERAILSSRTGISVVSINPDFATGWLDGWLRFRNTSLADVVMEANRYSGQKLRLGDPGLADIRLSGNFHVGDNSSIADAASLVLPVRVEQRGSEIVLMPQ